MLSQFKHHRTQAVPHFHIFRIHTRSCSNQSWMMMMFVMMMMTMMMMMLMTMMLVMVTGSAQKVRETRSWSQLAPVTLPNLPFCCAAQCLTLWWSICVKLKGNTWQEFAERCHSHAKTTGQTCRLLPLGRNQHFQNQEIFISKINSQSLKKTLG